MRRCLEYLLEIGRVLNPLDGHAWQAVGVMGSVYPISW